MSRPRGFKQTEETIRKMRETKLGSKNPMWRGDKVGYASLHEWMVKRKPKPPLCEECHRVPPHELSSTGHTYTRNLGDWRWLCRSCHTRTDIENGLRGTRAGTRNIKRCPECQGKSTKAGFTWRDRKRVQRWRCSVCGRIYGESGH